jgi:hypothetical protein
VNEIYRNVLILNEIEGMAGKSAIVTGGATIDTIRVKPLAPQLGTVCFSDKLEGLNRSQGWRRVSHRKALPEVNHTGLQERHMYHQTPVRKNIHSTLERKLLGNLTQTFNKQLRSRCR